MATRERLTRQESKAQTRRDIIAAATRLFVRDGFVATSLSAIAEEAGLTKGAVYSNFDSKEDLFLTIVRGEAESPRRGRESVSPRRWREALERDGSIDELRERLEELGRGSHDRAPHARQVALFLEYNAFALRNKRSREWVHDHNSDYFEEAGEAIRSALADVADLDPDDAEDVAALAQSLYVGLLLHRAIEPERFDEELFAKGFAALAALLMP